MLFVIYGEVLQSYPDMLICNFRYPLYIFLTCNYLASVKIHHDLKFSWQHFLGDNFNEELYIFLAHNAFEMKQG